MQRALGTALRVALLVVGAILVLAGAAATLLIGPDDTAQSGPHDVFTPGVAILTEAEALHYVGPTLHLTVERDDDTPVFVGVGNEVDVLSYVDGASRRVVSRVKLPWTPTATETGTGLEPLPAPGQQPWWIDSVDGAGAQELVWPIPHGRYSIAVLNADGSPAVDVKVTLGLEMKGAFYAALAVTVFGLALLLLGVWLWIRSRRRRGSVAEPAPDLADPGQPFEPPQSAEPTPVAAPFRPVHLPSEPTSPVSKPDPAPPDRPVAPSSPVAPTAPEPTAPEPPAPESGPGSTEVTS